MDYTSQDQNPPYYDFQHKNYLTRYLAEATQKKNSFKALKNVDKAFILQKTESFGKMKPSASTESIEAAGKSSTFTAKRNTVGSSNFAQASVALMR